MTVRSNILRWFVWPAALFLAVSAGTAELSAAEGMAAGKEATIRVFAEERAPQPIPKYITGKFCEHLGNNIYQGMDAQILRNPTFADYPFGDGRMSPDGVVVFQSDPREIARQLRQQAQRIGWPEGELDRLVEARDHGLACWWVREGSIESVQVSPDTGPHGGRAQRVQVAAAANGIAQWIFLPLHRVRKYEFEILARSPDVTDLGVALFVQDAKRSAHSTTVRGLSGDWSVLRGSLEVEAQGAGRRGVSAGDHGGFSRPVRHRPCPIAARRSHRERRSGRRAAIEAITAADLALAGRKLRQRATIGRMASGRPMLGRLCQTTPGVAWRRTFSVPTSSWISAAPWAASR